MLSGPTTLDLVLRLRGYLLSTDSPNLTEPNVDVVFAFSDAAADEEEPPQACINMLTLNTSINLNNITNASKAFGIYALSIVGQTINGC